MREGHRRFSQEEGEFKLLNIDESEIRGVIPSTGRRELFMRGSTFMSDNGYLCRNGFLPEP